MFEVAEEYVEKAINGIGSVAGAAWGGIKDLARGAWNSVSDFVDKVRDTLGLSPIGIDLDGDGIEVLSGAPVLFDMDNDGYLEKTAWIAKDDGFLAIDLSAAGTIGAGDGVINSAREISFGLWTNDANDSDLQALRIFDSAARGGNGDGHLSSADSIWGDLVVWQDKNQNGISDAGEVKGLSEHEITRVNLNYDDGKEFG